MVFFLRTSWSPSNHAAPPMVTVGRAGERQNTQIDQCDNKRSVTHMHKHTLRNRHINKPQSYTGFKHVLTESSRWKHPSISSFQLCKPSDAHSSLFLSLSWCLVCNIWLCCFTVKLKPEFGFPAGLNSPRFGTTTRTQCLSWCCPTSVLSSLVISSQSLSFFLPICFSVRGKHTDTVIWFLLQCFLLSSVMHSR